MVDVKEGLSERHMSKRLQSFQICFPFFKKYIYLFMFSIDFN